MNQNQSTMADAREWCCEFTAAHSENFVVASRWLLPEDVRDAYYALYAFARGADDRADETPGSFDASNPTRPRLSGHRGHGHQPDPITPRRTSHRGHGHQPDPTTPRWTSHREQGHQPDPTRPRWTSQRGHGETAALAGAHALDQWQSWLDEMYADGSPTHPAFVALRDVVRRYGIEKELFDRMLRAFRQDQTVGRYETWTDLRDYTRGSADPVGRWVLRVHGYHSPVLDRLSDAICTGLQLVNFIQDVREDLELRDRIYLPQHEMRCFGVTEAMLTQAPATPELRLLLQFQADRAERLFAMGRPLLDQVEPALRRQLILFHGGGRLALHAVRRARYDVTSSDPGAGKVARLALLIRALRGRPL